MAEPKHRRRGREEAAGEEEPEPLEAGLQGPLHAGHGGLPEREEDLPPDDYLLLKVVQANGEHLRTMRWGLGLGTVVLVGWVAFGQAIVAAAGISPALGGLAFFLAAGGLLGMGLQALARQLDLLRRAVAATDHYLFGPPEEPES